MKDQIKENNRIILFVPSVRKGNGTGHLRRCLEMAEVINKEAVSTDAPAAYLLLELEGRSLSEVTATLEAFSRVPVVHHMSEITAGVTVIDRRESSQAYVETLRRRTTVVGLDEKGPGRGFCDYLIDTLPADRSDSAPNRYSPAACAPRHLRAEPVTEHRSIIVTFGGEDPAGLTPLVCSTLVEKAGVPPERITAVRGPSAPPLELPESITVLNRPARLRELLHEFDLVITSFGLTAYEALASGVSVLLVNPSRYHRRLSLIESFPEAGVRRVKVRRLRKVLKDAGSHTAKMDKLRAKLAGLRWRHEAGLPCATGAISSLLPVPPARCPVCRRFPGRAVARFCDRTYFRCGGCGLLFLLSFRDNPAAYDESYFFEEYKAQYGKTYLEDFENIEELAGPRLRQIAKLLPQGGSLLDVGCAYGPFLSAATGKGFDCHGIDISFTAVRYVREELNIKAAVSDFTDFDPSVHFDTGRFDCLTMWYVIEHLENLHAALELTAGMVKPGGVFAFSTPNSSGISGKLALERFLQSSPVDHVTVWSPRVARRLLRRYGFEVRRIRVTGHHPERFPFVSEKRRGAAYRFVAALSRLFRLGDTFEMYAVRRGERKDA